MNDALTKLGIRGIPEFGTKYEATIKDYLIANGCGEPIGYSFTRIPAYGNEVILAIDLIGERGVVTIDYGFRVMSSRTVHPIGKGI